MVGRVLAPEVGRPYQVPARTGQHAPGRATLTGGSGLRCAAMRAVSTAFIFLLAIFVAACAGTGAAASFDPTGPCSGDGKAPGAYPELEARIPTSYEDRGPSALDSGRHCTPENLGSLAVAGFDEVRFAGGTWDLGGYRATALVVFEAPGLTADAIARFYTDSAASANRTEITGLSEPTIENRPGHRLDTTTGDRTQTVVVWPAATTDLVNVVITNDLPDPKIQVAIDAFGGE
jgi:hypothetical protein